MAKGSGALTSFQLTLTGVMVLYALFVCILYGRQRRWSGAVGWILLVGGVVALSAGLGDAFPWGGLAFIGVSALGGLFLAFDVAGRRDRHLGP